MRFPPHPCSLFLPRLPGFLALALLAIAQAVHGAPPTDAERLRTLQNEGEKFRDILRSQRNTPSPRRSTGPTTGELQLRAQEQARAQADADRRAAERYADSEAGREAAWRARYANALRLIAEEDAARAAKARAVQAEQQALIARMDRERWAAYRAANDNFTPRSFAPVFPTPAAALTWYLAHDRETPNPWAAGQAAILLIDGYGVPADTAAAARLLNPRTRREPAGEQPRPEIAALFAYLRAAHAEVCVPLGFPADPAAARRDLEALAGQPRNAIARWYLSRLMSDSPDPADHGKVLPFLPDGYAWMSRHPSEFLSTEAAGSFKVSNPVDATATAMLARAAGSIPNALISWPLEKISAIARLVFRLPEPQLRTVLPHFSDAAAERYLTLTPSPAFPYDEFDSLLVVAGNRGVSSAHAIAVFERLHLIGFDEAERYRPSFRRLNQPIRAISALTRWSARGDALGVRARLALSALAYELENPPAARGATVVLPEPFAAVTGAVQRYRDAAYVDTAHYRALSVSDAAAKANAIRNALQSVKAAMARRDAAAPSTAAVSALVDRLVPFIREKDQLVQLNEELELLTPADPALFAVDSPSFDLDRAAQRFDAVLTQEMIAVSDGPKRFAKLQALYDATRQGDAFAPAALGWDPDFAYVLTSEARDKLRALSEARRLRDEAAKRPRALAARVLESNLNAIAPDPALVSLAAASGHSLALRLEFEQRLKASLHAESDAPPSEQVPAKLVEEFDATLAALDARPTTSAERQFLALLMKGYVPVRDIEEWFPRVERWAEDRADRLASAALVKALRPSFEVLVTTLGNWPGINHEDARHEDWLDESDQVYHRAKELIATDGVEALTLCLEAGGRGNRDALDLLAYNLRHGVGSLPRSPEFADLLLAASLKIAEADAEVGDGVAAHNLGLSLMEGDGIPKNPTAGRAWLRYAAERGNHDAAGELRRMAEPEGTHVDPAAARRWYAVGKMIRANEYFPVPPRRLSGNVIELTPLRPALEAALAVAEANLDALKAKRLIEGEVGEAYDLYNEARDAAHRAPLTGLVPLAQLASTGNGDAAFATAEFIAGGSAGVRPDPALARRFQALALALQEGRAEFGDADDAFHLGLHHLELAEKPNPAVAIKWLTYAAELGNFDATEVLQTLYATGAPGVPADAKAAARWVAFGKAATAETFKPRAPLRR